MKKLQVLFIVSLFSCSTMVKEIPPPLKGSYENPVGIKNLENLEKCLTYWQTQKQFKVSFEDPVISLNLNFLDVRELLIKNDNSEDLFKKKYYRLRIYFDQYSGIDECKEFDLQNTFEKIK